MKHPQTQRWAAWLHIPSVFISNKLRSLKLSTSILRAAKEMQRAPKSQEIVRNRDHDLTDDVGVQHSTRRRMVDGRNLHDSKQHHNVEDSDSQCYSRLDKDPEIVLLVYSSCLVRGLPANKRKTEPCQLAHHVKYPRIYAPIEPVGCTRHDDSGQVRNCEENSCHSRRAHDLVCSRQNRGLAQPNALEPRFNRHISYLMRPQGVHSACERSERQSCCLCARSESCQQKVRARVIMPRVVGVNSSSCLWQKTKNSHLDKDHTVMRR